MAEREKKLALFETTCVVFWLLLDGFWLMQWHFLTYFSSAIAVIAGICIFFYVEKRVVPILIACADSSWLVMNILWAVGDLPDPDIVWCLTLSKIFFGLAVLFFVIAFFKSEAKTRTVNLLLRRLRLLRWFQKWAKKDLQPTA